MRSKTRDIFSKTKRSQIMSQIRGKNTKLEVFVFKELVKKGVQFRRHYSAAEGCPDIAIPSAKKAVFIDSDFWHGWQFPRWRSKLSSQFWVNKIEKNRKRDRQVSANLRRQGWEVLRVWSHELKTSGKGLGRICAFLNN